MLHIIIPMAGKGSRFTDYGFKTPKFLLPINISGETMIQAAVRTLNAPVDSKYTFITLESIFSEDLRSSLASFDPAWHTRKDVSNGPASTVFDYLEEFPSRDDIPIIISNSDQILENWDCSQFARACCGYDGGVLTYTPSYEIKIGSVDKHSFVELRDGKCVSFSEKIALSKEALVGVHYFRSRKVFLNAYANMIEKNERAPNKEFYLSLMYNALLRMGKTVINVPMKRDEHFHPTGEPADYFNYINRVGFGPRLYTTPDESIFSSDLLRVKMSSEKVDNSVYVNMADDSISTQWDGRVALVVSSPEFTGLSMFRKFSEMQRGWLIGDFEPSFFRTEKFELAILSHKAGERWPYHIHDLTDEYNYLLKGSMTINGVEFGAGDKFVLYKGHLAAPIFITDCIVVCIKVPSIPSDKRIV